jgi:DNA modification methylase
MRHLAKPAILIHGDCLHEMGQLNLSGVQLTYIDPPFFSGRNYETRDGELAFSDKWPTLKTYLNFMVARVLEAWRWTDGSLVLHLDHSVCHHVEVALEPHLGKCSSHIIWRYRRWPTKTENFQRVHDILLRWSRPGAPWTQLHEPLAASTLKVWGKGKQQAVVGPDGRRKRSSTTTEQSPGVPMGDVWDDIGIIAPSSKERTGYPTQKPKRLLARLITSCTEPGGLVLDPMMGSGTSLEAAIECGRRAIGIDSSVVAVAAAERRLGQYQAEQYA